MVASHLSSIRSVALTDFFFSVFEAIDILWDVWVLGPLAEGGREEGDDVGGLNTTTAALQACEEVAEGHLVVEGGLLL